jgi:hypothetical protein
MEVGLKKCWACAAFIAAMVLAEENEQNIVAYNLSEIVCGRAKS